MCATTSALLVDDGFADELDDELDGFEELDGVEGASSVHVGSA